MAILMEVMNPFVPPSPTFLCTRLESRGTGEAHDSRRWSTGSGSWFAGVTVIASIAVAGTLLSAATGAATPEAITTEMLLGEMTDLAGLAEFPNPAYTCRQFSSYDRASKSPDEDWFANNDRGQHLRVECESALGPIEPRGIHGNPTLAGEAGTRHLLLDNVR
jgi:hypothetical protein